MAPLSLRLGCIAALVPYGARVCDVGTDHAYLAIELLKSGKAKSVIATDINEKPLGNAKKNAEAANAENLELRLCDGLSGVALHEADTVIIAGMGGEVISGILERGSAIAKNASIALILQPTTSPEFLRKYLAENGFEIQREVPVSENGKHYSVMLVAFKCEALTYPEYFYFIGKITPETEAGLLYIKKQQNRCFKCLRALESIPSKAEEYLYYKQIYNGITDYLNSFKVG